MDKLKRTDDLIFHALSAAGHQPCVFFSGSLTSMLVLHLVKQFDSRIPVVTFAQDFTKEQWSQVENLILDWDLTVYTAPVSQRYVVPNKTGLSLIDEHHWAGIDLPIIRDMKYSDKCGLELSADRSEGSDVFWTTIFTGVLASDSHFVTNGNPFRGAAIKQVEYLTFVSPLMDWSKEEVIAYADEVGLKEIKGTGEISACTRCLEAAEDVFCPADNKMIPAVKWQPEVMLDTFRERFDYASNNTAN